MYSVGIAEGQDREPGVSKVGDLAVGDAGVLKLLVRGDEVRTGVDLEADVVQPGVLGIESLITRRDGAKPEQRSQRGLIDRARGDLSSGRRLAR